MKFLILKREGLLLLRQVKPNGTQYVIALWHYILMVGEHVTSIILMVCPYFSTSTGAGLIKSSFFIRSCSRKPCSTVSTVQSVYSYVILFAILLEISEFWRALINPQINKPWNLCINLFTRNLRDTCTNCNCLLLQIKKRKPNNKT